MPSKTVKPGHKLKVERETNKSSKSIDPYSCAIKIKHQFFDTWLTMRHIPREIWHHCYFFMEEDGNITGHIAITYKVFPVPSSGLEVLLLLTFSVKSERIFKLMKSFVNDLYDYAYAGEQAENNDKECGDNEQIDIQLIEEDNPINENNENVIKIDLLFVYPFLFKIVLDLEKKCF